MIKYIAIATVLLACNSCKDVKDNVQQVVSTAKACEFLADDAMLVVAALEEKKYELAVQLAYVSYMKSLEQPGTPCLVESKQLFETIQALAHKNAQDAGISQ